MTQTSTDNWMESGRGELEASLRVVVPFGPYVGHTIGYVRQHDERHLIWLEARARKPDVKRALTVVLNHYLEAIKRSQDQRNTLERWKLR